MAKIRICDICERQVSETDKRFTLRERWYSNFGGFNSYKYDLCTNCVNDIITTIKMAKKNGEED